MPGTHSETADTSLTSRASKTPASSNNSLAAQILKATSPRIGPRGTSLYSGRRCLEWEPLGARMERKGSPDDERLNSFCHSGELSAASRRPPGNT